MRGAFRGGWWTGRWWTDYARVSSTPREWSSAASSTASALSVTMRSKSVRSANRPKESAPNLVLSPTKIRRRLHRIAAIIRDVPEQLALEMTLVENLQREDLNPIEQARAFEKLMAEFKLTQEDVALKTGKERSTIANALRLLVLEGPIIEMLEEGRLTAGHGRALLSIPDIPVRMELAARAARTTMSVRELERIAARGRRQRKGTPAPAPMDANTQAAIDELQRDLGTRVILQYKTKKSPGRLILEFYDDEQLISLYERLRSR